MFLRVCAMYQLLLPNPVWPYVGDNMGQSWQQLMAHSLWTDHSDKALHEQKPGERSCGDESGSCPAAALQGHSRQLQERQRETKWQDIRYTDNDEERQILIHLGQKQYQVLKKRVTVMFRRKCWTTQLNNMLPTQFHLSRASLTLWADTEEACRGGLQSHLLHSHSYKLSHAAPVFEEQSW